MQIYGSNTKIIATLPSASATKGRKKSAVEKKEIVVAHMANKRQIPAKEKKYRM